MFETIINELNNALYSYVLIILLVLGGLYFTIRTRFAQFRLLGQQFKAVTEKTDQNGVSSFQALMVSTASRVGTGNIVGVATALCLGVLAPCSGCGSSPFWAVPPHLSKAPWLKFIKSGVWTAVTAAQLTTSKRL